MFGALFILRGRAKRRLFVTPRATINMGMQMKAQRLSGPLVSTCFRNFTSLFRLFLFELCNVGRADVGARLNNSWASGVSAFLSATAIKSAESSWRMRFLYNIHWAGKSAGFLPRTTPLGARFIIDTGKIEFDISVNPDTQRLSAFLYLILFIM